MTALLNFMVFFVLDNQQIKFKKKTCGWVSLTVRFKIDVLKPCWVSAPLQNAMPSYLLESVYRLFLLIGHKFALSHVAFNWIYGML